MSLPAALLFSLVNLAVILALLTALWFISVRIKDASIIDIAWGPACALPAVLTLIRLEAPGARALLLTALVSLWALRLAIYLGRRNLGHGEDIRYQKMRAAQGSDRAFALWSLPSVYWLQGLVAWFVSLPVQWGQFDASPLGILAMIGIVVFGIGFGFEAIGDFQLAVFKANPANKGKLMTGGLWQWTRHPNYFGDAAVWTGLTIVSIESQLGVYTILSPVVMIVFLVFISGKAMTERMMEKKYPDYVDYKRRTSGFFPLPPKSN